MKHKAIAPKQRILDTAFMLFHEQGYNSTGINQIIEEAAVAKASLYQHFKSKEELGLAYLNTRHEFWFDKLYSFTGTQKGFRAKILASFDFIAHMNELEHFRGCSFLNMLSEIPSTNTFMLTVIQQHKNDLRQFFATLLKGEDVQLADHVYFLFECAIIESKLFKDQWPVKRAKSIVSELLK